MHPQPVFLIGAQKCGTTSLYHYLSQHPQLVGARDPETGLEIKEPDFFLGEHWEKGFPWYESLFPDPTRRPLDATPDYFKVPDVAPLIAETFPEAKLIASLRCPVQRAISQHNHYMQEWETNPKLWDWCCPGESLEVNLYNELTHPFPGYAGLIGRGLYAAQLQAFARHIPKERILVVFMEEWQQDVASVWKQICEFLEIDLLPPPERMHLHHVRKHQPGNASPAAIELLRSIYEPGNKQLARWLGRRLPGWK